MAVYLACIALAGAQAALPATVPEIRASSTPWTPGSLTLTAGSNLVQTDVTVRDARGNPVPGLLKSNFLMFEDGRPQPFTYFSVLNAHGASPAPAPAAGEESAAPPAAASRRPRYIGLYFDDVGTTTGDLGVARKAALGMLHAGLGAADHVCVFTASGVQALDCTQDAAAVELAVSRIRAHPNVGGMVTPCPRISGYEAAQIVLYNNTLALNAVTAEGNQCDPKADSGYIAAEAQAVWNNEHDSAATILNSLRHATNYLSHQLGERVLLLASDGFVDDELGDAVQAVTETALHNDVVVNALDTQGLVSQPPGPPAGEQSSLTGPLNTQTFMFDEESRLSDAQARQDAMATLAHGTGGYFFQGSNDLSLGFQQLAATPPIVYELGFPLHAPHDGKYHKLQVKLTPARRGVTVQARPGYFAPAPGITVGEFFGAMDNAMRGQQLRSGVPVVLGIQPLHEQVDVTARFDVAKLPFIHHLGRDDQKLIVTAALFDSHGKLAAGKRGELDLWLLPATRKRFNTEGVQARLNLYTPSPGTYRLRVVVGESTDAQLSTFTETLQVH